MRLALFLAIVARLISQATDRERRAVERTGLDHVVIAVPDLDRSIRAFADSAGVTPAFGGRHPGQGSQNALLGLGDGAYLEFLAPVPDSEPAPDRRFLSGTQAPTPVGFAIGTENVEATVSRLNRAGFRTGTPTAGTRVTPTGDRLAWRTASLADAPFPFGPFLIEWQRESPHPSLTAPQGCRLAQLRVAVPEPGRFRGLLDLAGIRATVRSAAAPALEVSLRCPRGEVVLGGL
jgi:catechol 2,3-dioxygenase-like lactoylglutathione lyase family enzyme